MALLAPAPPPPMNEKEWRTPGTVSLTCCASSLMRSRVYSKVAPSWARATMRMFERSSSGASSVGSRPPTQTVSAMQAAKMGRLSQRWRMNAGQRPLVGLRHAHEERLRGAVEAAVAAAGLQHEAAHHGGERQGDEGADQHRARHHHAELAEEAPGQALQEDDGHEHRGQGDGGGDDREVDLARAFDGGLAAAYGLPRSSRRCSPAPRWRRRRPGRWRAAPRPGSGR